MNAGGIVAIITAVTALVAAVGTLLAQLGHLLYHKAQDEQNDTPAHTHDHVGLG